MWCGYYLKIYILKLKYQTTKLNLISYCYMHGRYNNGEENIIDVGKKMMRGGQKLCVATFMGHIIMVNVVSV